MLSLVERAGMLGAGEAFLEVRPSNTAAIRLYLSMGFAQVGMRRGYYQAVGGREDAAVFRLVLANARSVPGTARP
jgi:[ribosomal protein S18]-alanine N-acetyltransferase